MPAKKANTMWRMLTLGIITDVVLVAEAAKNRGKVEGLLSPYRDVSLGYLNRFLARYGIVIEGMDRKSVVDRVWAEANGMMADRLASKLGKGRFRDLLCNVLHRSFHRVQKIERYKPPIDNLVSPNPGDDENLLRQQREELLEKARARLFRKNIEHYQVFTIWEDDKRAFQEELNKELARSVGLVISYDSFREKLSKARDAFGRYLHEGINDMFGGPDGLNVDKCRAKFLELGLMEDYAMKSKCCRLRLDLQPSQ